MKDKSKVLKTYRDVCDKLHFVFLIGGRVCNPRQQHALNIYLSSLSARTYITYTNFTNWR